LGVRGELEGKKQCVKIVGKSKTTEAWERGIKQKTEDFEERKNWVLFCEELLLFFSTEIFFNWKKKYFSGSKWDVES